MNFQQPLLQSSVSHDPWFGAQEIFIIVSILIKIVLLNSFWETDIKIPL